MSGRSLRSGGEGSLMWSNEYKENCKRNAGQKGKVLNQMW